MTLSPLRLASGLALLVPLPAAAHPGHGVDPGSWLHLVAEPEHAVVWMALLAAAIGALSVRRVRRVRASVRRAAPHS